MQKQYPKFLIQSDENYDLDCFKQKVSFEIPKSVKRSITADIVNNKKMDEKAFKVKQFLFMRSQNAQLRPKWIKSLQRFYFSDFSNLQIRPSIGSFQKATQELNQTSESYLKDGLLPMAKNGIWNCMEFADFALIYITKNNLLKEGYIPGIAYLNNKKVPDWSYYGMFDTLDSSNQLTPEKKS